MKSSAKKTLLIILLLLLVVALAAVAVFLVLKFSVRLTNIEVSYTGGDVTVGQQPDKSKISVTAVYSDAHRKTVTGWTVQLDSSTAGAKKATVSYTEGLVTKTATFDVTVVAPQGGSGPDGGSTGTVADIQIHFLELGNQYTGDCVYIKAGETDILIDAGSRTGSASAISSYINKYCTDGILEYVIVTHAHQDHIAGFVGTNSAKGIFAAYECQNIITFAKTDATSQVYKNFDAELQKEVAAGANHFTAQECIDNTNGAQTTYTVADGITMEVLDQRFYREKSSDENNYSVCVMFTQGDKHYLFTGDLEKDGEESLVALNPDLPQVELFKAGHHGSYTASNDVLLKKIRPKVVCVCCCAGNVEYTQNLNNTFPAQAAINRIAPYTDCVYVTTLGRIVQSNGKWKNDGYESMNGNIVYTCKNGVIEVHGSNNDTKLKDTEWFKQNRTMPAAWAS